MSLFIYLFIYFIRVKPSNTEDCLKKKINYGAVSNSLNYIILINIWIIDNPTNSFN